MTAPYVQDSIPPGMVMPVEKRRRSAIPEWVSIGSLAGTAAADYATTLSGLKKGYTEANPVARPFAKAGPVPLGLLVGGATAVSALSGHELRKRGVKWWWVPSAIGTVLHGAAAIHNSNLQRGSK